jgi:hypothetical protein
MIIEINSGFLYSFTINATILFEISHYMFRPQRVILRCYIYVYIFTKLLTLTFTFMYMYTIEYYKIDGQHTLTIDIQHYKEEA